MPNDETKNFKFSENTKTRAVHKQNDELKFKPLNHVLFRPTILSNDASRHKPLDYARTGKRSKKYHKIEPVNEIPRGQIAKNFISSK